jgi:quinol monooxygenase YgiN
MASDLSSERTSISKGPHGVVIAFNVFVDPSNIEACIAAIRPVAQRFRAEPECLFCELSQNPNDNGHLRVLHGWTKGSEWWMEKFMQQPWFKEYTEKVEPMWVKPRKSSP